MRETQHIVPVDTVDVFPSSSKSHSGADLFREEQHTADAHLNHAQDRKVRIHSPNGDCRHRNFFDFVLHVNETRRGIGEEREFMAWVGGRGRS